MSLDQTVEPCFGCEFRSSLSSPPARHWFGVLSEFCRLERLSSRSFPSTKNHDWLASLDDPTRNAKLLFPDGCPSGPKPSLPRNGGHSRYAWTCRLTPSSRSGLWRWFAGRELECLQRIGRYSEGSVSEPPAWKLLLVHGLDDHPSRHTQAARCLRGSQDLRTSHRRPPSSNPSLRWINRMTVASSSWSPGATPASSIARRGS